MEKYHSPLLLYGLAEYREALQRFRNVVANYPDDPICDDVFHAYYQLERAREVMGSAGLAAAGPMPKRPEPKYQEN
jgi:hypothetical protein